MDNKQTAVEWLVSQVEMISNKKVSKKEAINLYNDAVAQAKEMEKQQIIDAAERWKGTNFAEQYYKETYKSNT